jgi:hypothetical protein
MGVILWQIPRRNKGAGACAVPGRVPAPIHIVFLTAVTGIGWIV